VRAWPEALAAAVRTALTPESTGEPTAAPPASESGAHIGEDAPVEPGGADLGDTPAAAAAPSLLDRPALWVIELGDLNLRRMLAGLPQLDRLPDTDTDTDIPGEGADAPPSGDPCGVPSGGGVSIPEPAPSSPTPSLLAQAEAVGVRPQPGALQVALDRCAALEKRLLEVDERSLARDQQITSALNGWSDKLIELHNAKPSNPPATDTSAELAAYREREAVCRFLHNAERLLSAREAAAHIGAGAHLTTRPTE
jgi:hypothetical protein